MPSSRCRASRYRDSAMGAEPSQLDRIEQKIDALLGALAAEGEEERDEPARSLDGEPVPGDRDQSQSLG